MKLKDCNMAVAQYIAGIDGKPIDNVISGWTRLLPCNWFIKTKNHSHSEVGWKLSALWDWIKNHPEILDELIATVPNFPAERWIRMPEGVNGYSLDIDGFLFFSAASRMGGEGTKPGTRFVMAEDLFNHPERWDIYGRKVFESGVILSFLRAWDERGKKYDWWGVLLGFASPGLLAAQLGKKAWYCSEVVYYAITGIVKRISPRRLGWWITKNGWEYLGNGSVFKAEQSAERVNQ